MSGEQEKNYAKESKQEEHDDEPTQQNQQPNVAGLNRPFDFSSMVGSNLALGGIGRRDLLMQTRNDQLLAAVAQQRLLNSIYNSSGRDHHSRLMSVASASPQQLPPLVSHQNPGGILGAFGAVSGRTVPGSLYAAGMGHRMPAVSNTVPNAPMRFAEMTNNASRVAAAAGQQDRQSYPPVAQQQLQQRREGHGASDTASEGVMKIPCHARNMPTDHNSMTAFFDVPVGAAHGLHLVCSHTQCRSNGVKFRYCLFCKKPVTKQNFRARHMHSDHPLQEQKTVDQSPSKRSKRRTDKVNPIARVNEAHEPKRTKKRRKGDQKLQQVEQQQSAGSPIVHSEVHSEVLQSTLHSDDDDTNNMAESSLLEPGKTEQGSHSSLISLLSTGGATMVNAAAGGGQRMPDDSSTPTGNATMFTGSGPAGGAPSLDKKEGRVQHEVEQQRKWASLLDERPLELDQIGNWISEVVEISESAARATCLSSHQSSAGRRDITAEWNTTQSHWARLLETRPAPAPAPQGASDNEDEDTVKRRQKDEEEAPRHQPQRAQAEHDNAIVDNEERNQLSNTDWLIQVLALSCPAAKKEEKTGGAMKLPDAS